MRARLDMMLYLLLVGAFTAILVQEWPTLAEAPPQETARQVQGGATSSLSSVGAIYSAVLWIGVPLGVFVWVNRQASRRFRGRIARRTSRAEQAGGKVPVVEVKTGEIDLARTRHEN